MGPISVQELYSFHTMDRNLFLCLIYTLFRDPFESVLVMAFWLWLEQFAHPHLIAKLVSLSPNIINALFNEAVLCLYCLEADDDVLAVAGGGDTLLLTSTLTQTPIPLHFFNQNRYTAIAGIKSILNNICSRIFSDILSHVYRIASSSSAQPGPSRPVRIPGFPHELYGAFRSTREERDLCDPDLFKEGFWRPSDDVSVDDRTMFLTFSRGFSVRQDEVEYLFKSVFGENSVDVIYMGRMGNFVQAVPEKEPLFATMVVDSVATVDRILNGNQIAKFKINGKHIWARKYERRE